jgi:hypothetical protein
MRSTRGIAILAGLLASAAPALAQTYPMQATIVVPRVDVRSGPTDKFYPTLELHQGEAVLVVRASTEAGWLEIRPPEGSFNWVNAKSVKQMGPTWIVVLDEDPKFVAPALVGSAYDGKPNKEAKHGFLAGSILRVVGQAHVDGADTWLPVQPDARDVRYIPANAVNMPPPATITAPTSWAIGSKSTNPPPAAIPGHPSGGSTDVKPAGNTTSYSPTPAAPSITPVAPAAPPVTNPPQWSGWGTLQRTTFTAKDGQPMFVLVNAQNQPLMYVTSRPGTNLTGYVNRMINLHGPTVYRPDEAIRTPYMIASHVAVP